MNNGTEQPQQPKPAAAKAMQRKSDRTADSRRGKSPPAVKRSAAKTADH